MVWIEIDDEVWDVFKKSWALLGTKTREELIIMLEIHMWESSCDVVEEAEKSLISDEPEALVLREIGLMKEKIMIKKDKEDRKR